MRALLFAISLVAITLALAIATFRRETKEKLEVVPCIVDLGTQSELRTVKKVVSIKNETNLSFDIIGITTSCHCTTFDFALPQTISSGRSIGLPISFETNRGDGRRTQTIYLHAKNNSTSKVDVIPITVTCNIKPEIRCVPAMVDFGILDADTGTVKSDFRLVSVSGISYSIKSATSPSPHISVETPTHISADSILCTASFTPPLYGMKGSVTGFLNFELNGGSVDSFRVPFRVSVTPKYETTPEVIVFNADATLGDSISLRIHSSSTTFKILEANCTEGFEIDIAANTKLNPDQSIIVRKMSTNRVNQGLAEIFVLDQNGIEHKLETKIACIKQY